MHKTCEHRPGRRQQRRWSITERGYSLPQCDQQRDRNDAEQNLCCDSARLHAKLNGMSKLGSDHFTSLPRILSNPASRPMPMAPSMMIISYTVSYFPTSTAFNIHVPAPVCRAIISLVHLLCTPCTYQLLHPSPH